MNCLWLSRYDCLCNFLINDDYREKCRAPLALFLYKQRNHFYLLSVCGIVDDIQVQKLSSIAKHLFLKMNNIIFYFYQNLSKFKVIDSSQSQYWLTLCILNINEKIITFCCIYKKIKLLVSFLSHLSWILFFFFCLIFQYL